MNCPRCDQNNTVKAGIILGKQRFRCKACGYHFTEHPPRLPSSLKRLVIHLYLEGLSYKKISLITEVSDVAVANWIKPMKDLIDPYRRNIKGIRSMHKIEHFMITRNLFSEFGWLIIGFDQNDGINLIGSHQTGNCAIDSK
jgi:transposase-like protein